MLSYTFNPSPCFAFFQGDGVGTAVWVGIFVIVFLAVTKNRGKSGEQKHCGGKPRWLIFPAMVLLVFGVIFWVRSLSHAPPQAHVELKTEKAQLAAESRYAKAQSLQQAWDTVTKPRIDLTHETNDG